MASEQFNVAAGRIVELANRVATNDPTNAIFLVVALLSSGLEDELRDYDTLAAVLAASNNEATNVGYSRLQVTSVTVTVDDTNDWTDVDMADPTWASVAAAGGAWGALLVCYAPDSTALSDATTIPLTKHLFPRTPDGGPLTAILPTGGFFRQPSNTP